MHLRLLLFAFVSTFFISGQCAAALTTQCFDADSNRFFPTKKPTSFDLISAAKLPQVKHDAAGRPTGLEWIPRPETVTQDYALVGEYQGNRIFRVTYREHVDSPDGKTAWVVCLMFGCQNDDAGGDAAIRPFFIWNDPDGEFGENGPRFDFNTRPGRPSTLKVIATELGTGAYTTDYTFSFTPHEAWLTERQESGRHAATKIYLYNQTGKLIRTKTMKAEKAE